MLRRSCGLPACQFRTREPLRLLDVGLIERVDAQALAQCRGRVFPAQELGAEVRGLGREDAGLHDLHIRRGAPGRILHNGNHATPVLAGAFGDELLDPIGERRDPWWWAQAQLVTSVLRASGDGHAERLRSRDIDAARSLEQGAAIEPGEGRGNHADCRQRGIAASDVRRVRNDGAELLRAGDHVQRSSTLGDGNELLWAGARRKVTVEGERFDGIPRLARDDEQRAREVRSGRAHRIWIRAVQHAQPSRAECPGEHIGDETRSAHPAH